MNPSSYIFSSTCSVQHIRLHQFHRIHLWHFILQATTWSTWIVVSCPDPTLSWRKGSGDYWALPWLCRVSNLDFLNKRMITSLWRRVNANMMLRYFIGLFRTETADSAQSTKHSTVTRLFSSEDRGSGNETIWIAFGWNIISWPASRLVIWH